MWNVLAPGIPFRGRGAGGGDLRGDPAGGKFFLRARRMDICGSKAKARPRERDPIPAKIGSNLGGEFTENPIKWVQNPLVLSHGQVGKCVRFERLWLPPGPEV